MRRHAPSFALLIALSVLLTGCFGGAKAAPGERAVGGGVTTIDVGYRSAAPAIDGELLDGAGKVDLADYRGRVVVLNFWASWCQPCIREAPMLKALSDELRPKDVIFIGVDIRDQRASASRFQQRYGIRYPSIFDKSAESVLAFDGKLPAYPPNSVILDKAGRVAARVTGETSAGTLRPLIEAVLAEAAP